jgi:hypothetical protein
MIRRGFWVATGAVLGVTGYRRVTRLASMLNMSKSRPGPGSTAAPRMRPAPGRVLAQTRPGRVAPRGVAAASDVRTHIARAVAAAGFLRDVRDGMAEYWDLHRGQPDPVRPGRTLEGQALETQALEAHTLEAHTLEAHTLEARGDRTSSGIRQQGRREP